MEVHFCDLCNESVPQRDLDLGRAFLHKGRVVCAACDHAMGGEAARAHAATRFSVERYAKDVGDLYERLLRGRA